MVAGNPIVLKAGEHLIPFSRILWVDIAHIEEQVVTIRSIDGIFEAHGFDAIEIIMLLKPSALEGRRLKWKSGAWAAHNLIYHPLMQIMVWLGFKRQAVRLHDWSTPRPRAFKDSGHV